ncbi:STM4014 family protein [Deinococcus altitudinis]|uniref:STM4014 family protein n=1 Tax=Deinococcus altitudinis TaxID=468914 RepID=UPI003891E6FC
MESDLQAHGALSPDVLLIAPPAGRRARAFQESLRAHGWPPARVVSYLDLMEGRLSLPALIRPGSNGGRGTVVRFDSPGEDVETELALTLRGGPPAGLAADLAAGELARSRAWFAGFGAVMRDLDRELRQAPAHLRMQRTEHLLTMFDKPATHARLQAAGVPVPAVLPEVHSLDELLHAARERGWARVFVKLAYGSSASGAVALEWSGERVQAVTTVRQECGRLYNSRRLRRLTTWPEVRSLVDALAPERLHVERWLPKASFAGRAMDLRVVVIGGRAGHALVRLGRGPITNLHLGNERGDIDAFRAEIGAEHWRAVQRTCVSALAAFPGALYGGVDLMLTPGWRRLAVLEVNAFGDYHRGVLAPGPDGATRDTYAAELHALLANQA